MKRSRIVGLVGMLGISAVLLAAAGCAKKAPPPAVPDRVTGETAPSKLDVTLEATVPIAAMVRSISHDAAGAVRSGDAVTFTVDAVVPEGSTLKLQVVETDWAVTSAQALGADRYSLRSTVPASGLSSGSYRLRASVVNASGVETAVALSDAPLRVQILGACALVQEKLDTMTAYFDFDDYSLRPDTLATIDRVATILKALREEFTVDIEGHCDERGTNEYNLALSERRAASVRDRLAALDAVEPARTRLRPYGEERPADPGHTEAAWAKNRRAEFKLNCGGQ